MNDWMEELASALGVEPLSSEETGVLLKVSREVAHGVERRFAPLSTFLLGVAVGKGTSFADALEGTRALIPEEGSPAGAATGGPPAG
jgi:hypothetical protein